MRLSASLLIVLVACTPTPLPLVDDIIDAPTASFTLVGPIAYGEAHVLDASPSMGKGLSYHWSFSDGGHAGTAKVAHPFMTPGAIDVVLTVKDDQGRSATHTQGVLVVDAPAPERTVSVKGLIRDLNNTPLSQVLVTARYGGKDVAAATSDQNGKVTLASVPAGLPVTVRLSRSDLAEQVKVVKTLAAAPDGWFDAVMITRAPAHALDTASTERVESAFGSALSTAGSAWVDAEGTAISGNINVSITPVDTPSRPDGAFPGLFEGLDSALTPSRIYSYGTIEVVAEQGGKRLNLAPGTSAEIDIPVFAANALDGHTLVAGEAQPLWALDEHSGRWIQEGTGVLVASAASPTGLALRARVAHFSWWNHDWAGFFDDGELECINDEPGQYDDVFTQATYCNVINGGGGNGLPPIPGFNTRQAAAPPASPATYATTDIPMGRTTTLAFPVDMPMFFAGTALNGTWRGQLVNVPALTLGQKGNYKIRLKPIDTEGLDPNPPGPMPPTGPTGPTNIEAVAIDVGWDEIYTLSSVSDVDAYEMTLEGGKIYELVIAGNLSTLEGEIVLSAPGIDTRRTWFGDNPSGGISYNRSANLVIAPATTTTYTATVSPLRFAPGAYRVVLAEAIDALPVLATSPTHKATGVALSPTFTVSAGRNIGNATGLNTLITLNAAATNDGTAVTCSVANAVLSCTPTAPMPQGLRHNFIVSENLKDTNDNTLPHKLRASFYTQEVPGALTTLASTAKVALASAPNGDAMLVTSQGAPHHVRLNAYHANVGWDEAFEIRTAAGPAPDPKIDADAAGTFYVTYISGSHLYLQTYKAPGLFTEPLQIDDIADAAGESVNEWHAFVAPNGSIFVVTNVYVTADTIYRLEVRRFVPGTGWGTSEPVATSSTGVYSFATNASGDAVIAFHADNALQARRFFAGSWENATPLETLTSDPIPTVAINDDAHVVVLWRVGASAPFAYHAITRDGIGWDAGTTALSHTQHATIPEDLVCPGVPTAQLKLQDNGDITAIICGVTTGPATEHLVLLERPASGAWSATELTNASSGLERSWLVADAAGNLLAGWNTELAPVGFNYKWKRGGTWDTNATAVAMTSVFNSGATSAGGTGVAMHVRANPDVAVVKLP